VLPVNDAPVIVSNGGGEAASVTLAENAAVVTSVVATDPDSGVAYAIVGGADQAWFRIDAATGSLSFIAPPDYEAPADADGDNSYVVQVRASDGDLSDHQTLTVAVTDETEPADLAGLGDVLWRHDNGAVTAAGNALGTAGPSWQIRGTGDFDRDGDADILWRHDQGLVVGWGMEDGAYVRNHNFGVVANTWQVRGTGEFDLA
jgi:hypothetical protein